MGELERGSADNVLTQARRQSAMLSCARLCIVRPHNLTRSGLSGQSEILLLFLGASMAQNMPTL